MSFSSAYLGSMVADALAMPAHWYYDPKALLRDYGHLDAYKKPKNPHPGSILWRSHYKPLNKRGDILHDQAAYWGQRDVHYHQFLASGENTINLRLARTLHDQVLANGSYDPDTWLQTYVDCMLTPGWHSDTYLEEYHRAFFTHYALGKPLRKCGISDEHIGGLAQVPALIAAVPAGSNLRAIVKQHVALTHSHAEVLRAADCFTQILQRLNEGLELRDAIRKEAGDWFSSRKAIAWSTRPDTEIIGQKYSPACYIRHAFPASIYLAWKYHDRFDEGIIANAMVGGDNCHRGVVVGALLGAANGVPPSWLTGLKAASDRIPAPIS